MSTVIAVIVALTAVVFVLMGIAGVFAPKRNPTNYGRMGRRDIGPHIIKPNHNARSGTGDDRHITPTAPPTATPSPASTTHHQRTITRRVDRTDDDMPMIHIATMHAATSYGNGYYGGSDDAPSRVDTSGDSYRPSCTVDTPSYTPSDTSSSCDTSSSSSFGGD